jgi:hypothetical protein
LMVESREWNQMFQGDTAPYVTKQFAVPKKVFPQFIADFDRKHTWTAKKWHAYMKKVSSREVKRSGPVRMDDDSSTATTPADLQAEANEEDSSSDEDATPHAKKGRRAAAHKFDAEVEEDAESSAEEEAEACESSSLTSPSSRLRSRSSLLGGFGGFDRWSPTQVGLPTCVRTQMTHRTRTYTSLLADDRGVDSRIEFISRWCAARVAR